MLDIQKLLAKHRITPNPAKDQHFLTDQSVIDQMINLAELSKKDIVLEIGAGTGNLTRAIAKKAGQVIAFECDPRFKPLLAQLPANIELRWEDAWDYVQLHGKYPHRKRYNKIVANLPYSFAEKLLHNLTFLIFDRAILLIPRSLIGKINKHHVFSLFFRAEERLTVANDSFYPSPKTSSAIAEIIKLPDPLETRDRSRFLGQCCHQHEAQLAKNSLREGLINYSKIVKNQPLTKNQARKIIGESGVSTKLLENRPAGHLIYQAIKQRF